MRDWFLELDHGRVTLVEADHGRRYLLGLSVASDFVDAEARCEVSRAELGQVVALFASVLNGGAAKPLPAISSHEESQREERQCASGE